MEKLHSEKNFGWRKSNTEQQTYTIKEFNNQVFLVNALGEPFPVNNQGSLALLALGEQGLQAWRKAKKLNPNS